jgi:Zn-dependent membrane protease YugP
MLYMPFDSSYLIFVLPALVFSLIAQAMVQGRFKKYSRQLTARNVTGAQAAQEMLRRAGVYDVKVERVSGSLTDHFDPRSNTIRLSEAVYSSASVAAVGIAAHETGHSLQYQGGYVPMKIRAAVIPATNLGSRLAMPLVLIGLFTEMAGLINIGILLFCAVVFFQLITLPVEFNASARAIRLLDDAGLLYEDELPGAKKVLAAAAMTYVAALAVALAQLLRLLSLTSRRRR